MPVPTGPVKIDTTNPIAAGLICAYLPGVSTTNYANPGTATLTRQAAATITSNADGAAMGSPAGTSAAYATAPSALLPANTSEWSMFWRGDRTAAGGQVPYFAGISQSNTYASPYMIAAITVNVNVDQSIRFAGNSGGVYFSNIGTQLSDINSTMHNIAGTFKVGGTVFGYKNGTQIANPAFGVSAPTAGTGPLVAIGCDPGIATAYTAARTNVVYFWNRQISAAEVTSLQADPYQLFVPLVQLVLSSTVLDNGLGWLDSNADGLYLCSAQPTTFTEATSTFALGNDTYTPGTLFGAPADDASPLGRQVTSVAATGGTITSASTPSAWAVVDSVNSVLLASGPLTSSALSMGNTWSMDSITITIPTS